MNIDNKKNIKISAPFQSILNILKAIIDFFLYIALGTYYALYYVLKMYIIKCLLQRE